MEDSAVDAACSSFEFITADKLLEEEGEEELLSTGLAKLDTLLYGGLTPGALVEIVGPSGTGKSQLCMQLAVNVQKQKGKNECVYIDTEGGFSTKRICDIVQKRLPFEDSAACLQRIHHSRCHDVVQLTSALHRLEALILQNPKVGLIILDSVAMPLRGEGDHMRHTIIDFSRLLSRVAVLHRCVVVVVNHVAYRFQSDDESESCYLASALGTSWPHHPTCRLWLCPAERTCANRSAHLMKSPFCALGTAFYTITEGGIEGLSESPIE